MHLTTEVALHFALANGKKSIFKRASLDLSSLSGLRIGLRLCSNTCAICTHKMTEEICQFAKSKVKNNSVCCRWLQTVLGYLTSPVALLSVMLMLVGGVVVLQGINSRLLRQGEAMLTELRAIRRAQKGFSERSQDHSMVQTR